MQFRDLQKQYEVLKPEMDAAMIAVASGAHFISGEQVKTLEERLAAYVGRKHCITCGNGTDALELCMMAWGIGPGDAVFVPAFASENPRCGFCTKHQSLPDMVRNTFRDRMDAEGCQVLSLFVHDVTKHKGTRDAYVDLAVGLGASPHEARKAYGRAMRAQKRFDEGKAKAQAESLALIGQYRKLAAKDPSGAEAAAVPVPILVVAHPYVSHDAFVAGDVLRGIEEAGGFPLFADQADHDRAYRRSFDFSDTLPWEVNRELVGAILDLQDEVAGIVVLTAFPCGPDSLFADALVRDIAGIPVLRLVLDAQSGSAGVQTRIESFMDILKYQAKGGDLHG